MRSNLSRLNKSTTLVVCTIFLSLLLGGSDVCCEEIELFSKVLGEQRIIKVRLPEDYGKTEDSYAVLYVLDADYDAHFEAAVKTAFETGEAGTAPRMIVVGITNTVRNRDMIPAAIKNRSASGGSDKFLEFIAGELIPHIDSNFRVSSPNILYGGSNAGLFTVYAILKRPELFEAAIAGSPMIGHCSDYMYRAADRLKKGEGYRGRTLFMTYGGEDSDRCIDFVPPFHKRLVEIAPEGFRTDYIRIPEEGHVPESSLEKGLIYIFTEAGSSSL